MTSAPSSSRVGRMGKLSVQLLVTGVVTWFILRALGLNLAEIRSVDLASWEVNWGLFSLASLVLLVAYLYSAALWGLMVREIGGHEMGLLPSLRVFFTANLGRYLPGKLWQIAGLAYLSKAEGVPASTATGSAVLGQVFSLAGATLVGSGVLLASRGGAGLGGEWTAGVLLVLLVGFTIPAVLRQILRLWFRIARTGAPEGVRTGATFGLRWMGLYAFGWTLQGLAFWILVRSLGLDLTAFEGLPAYPAAYVLGYVALFAPAGIGVREGMLIACLQPALGLSAAWAVALMARLWTTVMELLLALSLAGGYLGFFRKGEGAGV
jgi:uncharacterized membrane protein YbhN (UPF0104 family)